MMLHDELNYWHIGLPGSFGENYTHETWKSIREKGELKWLYSLPMYEYAFILTIETMYKYGGKPDKYYEDLYKTRMNPILKQYYDKLMHYRIMRSILEQKFESMKSVVKDTDLTKEYRAIRVYAYKTRKALRGVVQDFIEEVILHTRTTRKPVEDTLQETYGSC